MKRLFREWQRKRDAKKFKRVAFGETARAFSYRVVEQYLTDVYGARCETTDLTDFPELRDGGNRCQCCVQWEVYDDWRAWQGD